MKSKNTNMWPFIAVIGFAMLLGGCATKPPALTTPPDFAPLHSDASSLTSASGQLGDAMASMPSDPLTQAITPAAQAVAQVAAVLPQHVSTAEAQSAAYQAAAKKIAADDASMAAKYQKEKTSWFGGRLGHIAWWGMIVGGIVALVAALASVSRWIPALGFLTIIFPLLADIPGVLWKTLTTIWGWIVAAWTWMMNFIASIHAPTAEAVKAGVKTGVTYPLSAPATEPKGAA